MTARPEASAAAQIAFIRDIAARIIELYWPQVAPFSRKELAQAHFLILPARLDSRVPAESSVTEPVDQYPHGPLGSNDDQLHRRPPVRPGALAAIRAQASRIDASTIPLPPM